MSLEPPPTLDVQIQNPSRYGGLDLRAIRPWIRDLVAELAPTATSFGVRLTSDRDVRGVNFTYRQRDKSTDVLSFPGALETPRGYSGDDPDESPSFDDGEIHLGDVIIAVPTARRQARVADHDLATELRILVLHGILHCLGYDHERDDGTMERREAELRRQWLTARSSDNGVMHDVR
ncbi:MAG: rRNA maturation RNase YbeY [Acidobacteriota bacterium]